MRIISLHNPSNVTFGPGCLDQMVKDYIATDRKRIFINTLEPINNKIKTQIST